MYFVYMHNQMMEYQSIIFHFFKNHIIGMKYL